jgi:hypothetical protein
VARVLRALALRACTVALLCAAAGAHLLAGLLVLAGLGLVLVPADR